MHNRLQFHWNRKCNQLVVKYAVSWGTIQRPNGNGEEEKGPNKTTESELRLAGKR